MSEFLSGRARAIKPYTPGEQNRGRSFIRLNTNESPFPPPKSVTDAIAETSARLNVYSDPEARELRRAIADYHGVAPDCVTVGNGSDETLAFIVASFAGERGIAAADVTYSFYKTTASFFGVPYEEVRVRDDFSLDAEKFHALDKLVMLANPNAPTGLSISNEAISRVAETNPDSVVVVDEAYADFAGFTAVPLTARHGNLIVVRTFSKSRFLAGARLGYSVSCPELAADLERVRFAWNPYNVNAMTQAAGIAALSEDAYYRPRWREIANSRGYTKRELRRLGFFVTDSDANFVFCRRDETPSAALYAKLREAGILVRLLPGERTGGFLRITIGAQGEAETLIGILEKICGGGL